MYIFKQAKTAIFDFDKYPELLETKLSKVIFYALFFIILFNAIYCSSPFFSYYLKTKGFDNFVESYIPDFKVENDKLVIDKYSKVSTPLNITIIFDPEENNYISSKDKEDVKGIIFKFTPSHIISSELGYSSPIDSIIIKMFDISEKSDLINLKPLITISSIFVFSILFFVFVLMDIFFLGILNFVITLISNNYKLKLTPSSIFKLSVYVNTMPYILKIVFYLFSIPMHTIIYIGIVASYLYFIFKQFLMSNDTLKTTNSN